ncbi:MAG: hypothetical protein RLZZ58_1574, partial [Pseudomonadota bacterium]
QPDAVSLASFQALLAPDEAALMIVPSGDGTHIFAVTKTSVAWHRSDWGEDRVAAATRRLLWFAGADVEVSLFEATEWKEQVPGLGAFDRTTAHDLYQALIAPVAPLFAGKRHLFVAGAGPLAKLPFSILVSAPPTGSDNDPAALRATRWFADDFALIHLPALQSLAALRNSGAETNAATGGFLGIGDPILDGVPQRRVRRGADAAGDALADWPIADNGMVDVARLRRMARLPGTAAELSQVAARFPLGQARLMTGSAATEPAVRADDLSRYGIIAFATHGLMAGEVAGAREAGLVLTPPATARDGDDGYLSVSDVSGLTLNADWIILSACNSAADDGSAGAVGLSGLARAFFYAGGRALLASHWPVLDDVAVDLVVGTVTPDTATPSKAVALQRAMKAVRDSTTLDTSGDSSAHPAAWAPFVLIGDWR